MKKLLILTALWSVLSGVCIAATLSFETVVTSASGDTVDDAIDTALRRAVEQVSGVSIDSVRVSALSHTSTENASESIFSMKEGTSFKTGGNVKYRILEQKCVESNCSVRLNVSVQVDPRSKVKDLNSNRRTIAIETFSGKKGQTLSRQIRDKLVQDRKFRVLDDDSDISLQYKLTGRVIEAYTRKRVEDNSRTVELTGEVIEDRHVYYSSRVVVEYQIVDVIHNQVKWSATVPTTSKRNNLPLLLEISAGKIFSQLKENIYPIVVLVTAEGNIVFNSGGETVKTGDYYDVFSLGEKLVDPVTKETLGYDEIKVATVRVSKVLPKISYVEVVSGDESAVQDKSIARRSKKQPTFLKSHKSKATLKPVEAVEEESSVGIVL